MNSSQQISVQRSREVITTIANPAVEQIHYNSIQQPLNQPPLLNQQNIIQPIAQNVNQSIMHPIPQVVQTQLKQ